MQSEQRTQWLLGLGAALGLSAAAGSLLVDARERREGLPADTVATVNDVGIRSNHFLRAVEGLASDRREPLAEADRKHVLNRLIEEELLVQHALDLGLAQRDRRARSYLVSSVLDSIVAETESFAPSEGEVEDFYAANGDYFARPGRLRVRQVFFSLRSDAPEETVAATRQRADRAVTRLRAGEAFVAVQSELGDREIAGIPDAPLPPAKLREYLGPTGLQAAQQLETGQVSEAIRSPQGFHVLWMVRKDDVVFPPLVDVEAQVRAEMKRRAGDLALRENLDDLRAQAEVIVRDPLP